MKELAALDVESILCNQKKPWRIPKHPLFPFFKEEYKITYHKIGQILGCSQMSAFNYLTGRTPVPVKIENGLQALAQRIRELEKESNTGGDSLIRRKAIKNK